MPDEDHSSADNEQAADSVPVPEIEDAYALPEAPTEEIVAEDDPQLLEPASRSLEGRSDEADATEQAQPPPSDGIATGPADADDTSDSDAGVDETKPDTDAAKEQTVDWANETSAQKIVVELKHIETEVRRLLQDRDTKRKRRLAGTRRWSELEDDIVNWRFSGRIDEPSLARLGELIARRHFLFRRLRFVAGTRPTWNT